MSELGNALSVSKGMSLGDLANRLGVSRHDVVRGLQTFQPSALGKTAEGSYFLQENTVIFTTALSLVIQRTSQKPCIPGIFASADGRSLWHECSTSVNTTSAVNDLTNLEGRIEDARYKPNQKVFFDVKIDGKLLTSVPGTIVERSYDNLGNSSTGESPHYDYEVKFDAGTIDNNKVVTKKLSEARFAKAETSSQDVSPLEF